MEEKKTIKISLGTVICICIIIILIFALGIMYYLGFVKDKGSQNIITEQNVINYKKDEANTVVNISGEESANKTLKVKIGKKYKYETPAKYGKNGEVIEAGEGADIIFNEDNTFESNSWSIPGGVSGYKGNYKIEGNEIIITINKTSPGYDSLWGDYEKSNEKVTYTILSDTQIKNSANQILKITD